MLKKIFAVVGLLLLGLFAFVMTRPDTFSVERTTTIAAPAPVVFAQVNDFHNWLKWSPWEQLDPQMKKTFEGASAGTGASYSWDSPKDDVGAGKMTITDSKPNERIDIKLEFQRPFEATNPTTFTFKSAGDQTEVTWKMQGGGGFQGRVMNAFMNMDQAVGKDFDQGLTAMKAIAQAEAKQQP